MLVFQPFKIEHKPIIEQYLKTYRFNCSEFTFTNFIIWGQDDKIQWAEHSDVLYIMLKFGSHPAFMFPPIPRDINSQYDKVIDVALKHFYELGTLPRFRSVCTPFLDLFIKHCPQFSIVPDRNTFDYIYKAEDLINLAGRKYHSKRNHVNQFTSQYDYEFSELSVSDADKCMELYMSWLKDKDISEPGILGEMKAIKFLLPNMDKLGVKCGGIYVNSKLVAFSLGEIVRDDLAIIHIEKADATYVGLYAVINQQFAANCFSGVNYINREEDMGIPGMRKAKLSYHPEMLVEKYDVVSRP